MARQIIQQPDGKFAIWSTTVDDFILTDADPQELIDFWLEEARRDITNNVTEVIAALQRGEQPYYQFTKSFEDCLKIIRQNHGADAPALRHFSRAQN